MQLFACCAGSHAIVCSYWCIMPEIEDDDVDDDDDDLVIFPLTDLNGDSGNSSDADRYISTACFCSRFPQRPQWWEVASTILVLTPALCLSWQPMQLIEHLTLYHIFVLNRHSWTMLPVLSLLAVARRYGPKVKKRFHFLRLWGQCFSTSSPDMGFGCWTICITATLPVFSRG